MKRRQMARELAREEKLPAGKAQDEIDALAHHILHKLRGGKTVKLPGIGRLLAPPKRAAE
jgi:nucleoid DNA-binding protein